VLSPIDFFAYLPVHFLGRTPETPPEKAYGYEDEKHVGGRPLVFEITMLDTNTED